MVIVGRITQNTLCPVLFHAEVTRIDKTYTGQGDEAFEPHGPNGL